MHGTPCPDASHCCSAHYWHRLFSWLGKRLYVHPFRLHHGSPATDSCALIKSSRLPRGMHLSHEISRWDVRTTWSFLATMPKLPRHTYAKNRTAQSVFVEEQTVAADVDVQLESMSVENCALCGKSECVVLFVSSVGQLLLLARPTRTASWPNSTATPCRHFSFSNKCSTWYNSPLTMKHTYIRWGRAPLNNILNQKKYFTPGTNSDFLFTIQHLSKK